jgi:hypothetical protein
MCGPTTKHVICGTNGPRASFHSLECPERSGLLKSTLTTPGMLSIHPSTVAASHPISHSTVSIALGAMSSLGLLYRPSRVQPSVAHLSTSQLPCYHMAAALSQPCPSAPNAAQLGALDTSRHAMSAAQRAAIDASDSGMIARSA